ncbi:two-component system sensor histidine kinase NtrB [Ramlibacter sp. PS4R-6]|uniref:two-component system sensor histidine kinase NtrB n=1 Tax=Ramlibacter sp. PS4R-6 TaxID=3133438 RepID=UPI0030B09F4B
MKREPALAALARWRSAHTRLSLWALLVLLVAGMLATLVWLAGRYETSMEQGRVERDTFDAANDIRAGLTRNVQTLQALHSSNATPAAWTQEAQALLRSHREWMRLEWRDATMKVVAAVDTPFRPPVFTRLGRGASQGDINLACAAARRLTGPAYSTSYFVPQMDGLGIEVMELCLPQATAGQLTGYVIASYSLAEVLNHLIEPQLAHSHDISFTEADGTRLALRGAARRGSHIFTGQQLLDLPGNTVVLRMDSWRAAPQLFPNVLTAILTAMAIALLVVLWLLGKDTQRRLRAERDLADALAFRKAMEDSLVTGLRARDLQGRTTYVNPAFCAMVGFGPDELLGKATPAPYWPPEFASDYAKRQERRLSGRHSPPREGFESIFMRKDGTRFPVLVIEAPLINHNGVQTGWMSAFLDLSEQRRVEELSRASQERLQATARLATVGEMASLLSHELNQPLAAISSYATGSLNLLKSQVTAGGDESIGDIEVAMKRIAEQAERAGKVIKSVHDFVRRRDKEREPIAPDALVDSVMPLVSLQARKLGVRVETHVDASLPPVLVDRTMVEQVLLNLARNAMQAMDESGVAQPSLLIEVRRAGGASLAPGMAWLEFSVADVGPGIPAEVQQQLFTPFFTTKTEGMGLGLSLCRTVVEQHGGFLAFEPNRPTGTIFRFTLPVDARALAAATP